MDSYKNDEIATEPKIAAWTTLDANYSCRIEDLFGTETTIFLGTRNLTDEDSPPLPSGREGIHRHNLRPGYDGLVHDIKGRTIYLRFRASTGGDRGLSVCLVSWVTVISEKLIFHAMATHGLSEWCVEVGVALKDGP